MVCTRLDNHGSVVTSVLQKEMLHSVKCVMGQIIEEPHCLRCLRHAHSLWSTVRKPWQKGIRSPAMIAIMGQEETKRIKGNHKGLPLQGFFCRNQRYHTIGHVLHTLYFGDT